MKFFQMILVIASLALLCTGCSSEPIGSHDSSAVQADGGTNDGGSTDSDVKSQNDSSADVEIQWNKYTNLTVHIQTPDGLPADIYICGVGCYTAAAIPYDDLPDSYLKKVEGVKDMDYVFTHQNGKIDFAIYAVRKNYLFTRVFIDYIVGDKTEDTMSITWTDVGSWGLAPNGTYKDSLDGKNKSVTTAVSMNAEKDFGKIVISLGDASVNGIVTGTSISETATSKLTGSITESLENISYSWINTFSGKTLTGSLTLNKK